MSFQVKSKGMKSIGDHILHLTVHGPWLWLCFCGTLWHKRSAPAGRLCHRCWTVLRAGQNPLSVLLFKDKQQRTLWGGQVNGSKTCAVVNLIPQRTNKPSAFVTESHTYPGALKQSFCSVVYLCIISSNGSNGQSSDVWIAEEPMFD